MPQERLSLLGISIHPVTTEEVLARIKAFIQAKKKASVLHLNIHGAVLAQQYPWMKDFYNRADLLFCDGDGVRWGLRLLGYHPPPKIPLTRRIWDLAAFSAQEGFRMFFIGAEPGVAEIAAGKLQEKYPKLQLAGVHHGYFQKQGPENDKVIAKINDSRADIVVVCFGMPIQERWIIDNMEKVNASVFLPSGAVLDWVAGRFKEAPEWMIRFHLEWLFRIWLEPRRLFGRYTAEIPYFFLRVLGEKCFTSRRSRTQLPE